MSRRWHLGIGGDIAVIEYFCDELLRNADARYSAI
jgi:hypothetical protein